MKAARDMNLCVTMDGEPANVTRAGVADDGPGGETLRWFDELRRPLRLYLICAGANPPDADDAVQETFLRLHQHLEKGGDRSNIQAWVFQVARNYLRDDRRSARKRRTAQW